MTQQVPQQMQLTPENALVRDIVGRIKTSLIENVGPEPVLVWLKTQPIPVIRKAIIATQPKAYAIAAEPLIESLPDEQCIGLLVAMLAVYVQTL